MSSALSPIAKGGKLCSFAALILYDEQLDITGENIQKLIKSSNNSVPAFLPNLFAKSLEDVDIKQLLSTGLVGSAQPSTGGVAVAATTEVETKEKEAEEEAKSESSEESDADFGLSIFD